MPSPDDAASWSAAYTRLIEHKHAGSFMAALMSFAAIMLLGEWLLTPIQWYVAASMGAGVGVCVALVNHKTPQTPKSNA